MRGIRCRRLEIARIGRKVESKYAPAPGLQRSDYWASASLPSYKLFPYSRFLRYGFMAMVNVPNLKKTVEVDCGGGAYGGQFYLVLCSA